MMFHSRSPTMMSVGAPHVCDIDHRDPGWVASGTMRARVQGLGGMRKRRLDTLLAERGLFASRTRAAASVMAGEVRLGVGERRALKPGEMVAVDEVVRVQERPAFVSRGGIKLANALASSGLVVEGRRALDVGASTGGFTDCLLQRGAREVIAVDVSFISLGKVLGAVIGCLAAGYDVLALVKPQFELGRGRVGKGGVVRDPADRREALLGVGETAIGLGAAVLGYHSSELPGPKGNRETFIWLSDPAGGRGVRD